MRLIDADAAIKNISHVLDATENISQLPMGMIKTIVTGCLEAEPTVGGWISVDDRVPEDGLVGMLVYDGENPPTVCTTCITITDAKGKKLYSNNQELIELMLKTIDTKPEYITHITHWMPMPEPPYPMMEV